MVRNAVRAETEEVLEAGGPSKLCIEVKLDNAKVYSLIKKVVGGYAPYAIHIESASATRDGRKAMKSLRANLSTQYETDHRDARNKARIRSLQFRAPTECWTLEIYTACYIGCYNK